MRRLGAIIPLWNGELFIKPHLDMLAPSVDKVLVLMQRGPLPSYEIEHGYDKSAGLTREILAKYHPEVEVVESNYDHQNDFRAELYNEGLGMMEDFDIVFRLDPDMFWNDEDWNDYIDFILGTNYDCYRMDFSRNSINYYMTGDFDHGLKDAQEMDPLAVNPKKRFTGIVDYPLENTNVYSDPDWTCHHFRGWGKPKSTPPGWDKNLSPQYVEAYGGWISCPSDIKNKLQSWLDELEEMKK